MFKGYHIHPTKSGEIELELEWGTPLPHNVTILVYLSYDTVIVHKRGELAFNSETL